MAKTALKMAEPQMPPVTKITVCRNPEVKTCGGENIYKGLTEKAGKMNLPVHIEPAKCGCSVSCQEGAFLSFPDLGVFYHKVKEGHIEAILEETVKQGKIIFPLLRLNPLQSIRGDLIWEKATGCLMALDPSICMVEVADYLMDELGTSGGWALGSGNSIPEFIPIDNYLAMMDQGWKRRRQ